MPHPQQTHEPRPVALVTGASRGLGRVLARFLAAASYDLVVTARDASSLQAVADELRAFGGAVVAQPGDVRDPAHRRDALAAAGRLGPLDLLVNNASTLGPSPLPDLVEAPPEALREAWAVNVEAPLAWVREALPQLRPGALVVNVTSDAAVGAYPRWGVYGSTKAALELLSRTLAVELRDRGVGVVAVDPGDMRTRMHQDAFVGEDISDRPEPEVTLPFWGWLLSRPAPAVSGGRYAAQSEGWSDVASPLAAAATVPV